MEEKFWRVEFENTPEGKMTVVLEKKLFVAGDGFGSKPAIYPVTIVQARYGGSYEGGFGGSGDWLAFPVNPWELAEPAWEDWCGSDVECMKWWDRAATEKWPIGHGASPDAAYTDLIDQVAREVGLSAWDLMEAPTWKV